MNAKGDLIARLLGLGLGAPSFEAAASGPAHDRIFRVTVLVGGRPLGAGGEGRSKKDAERLAAEAALRALDSGAVDSRAAEAGATTARPQRPETAPVWPIYAGVLAQALNTALELSAEDATLAEVRQDAVRLYQELLLDLGHGPEAE